MGDDTHARRRSSSLASVASMFSQGGQRSSRKKKRPSPSPNRIPEDDEGRYSDDDFSGRSGGGSDDTDTNVHSDEGLDDDEETGLTGKERQRRRRRKRRNTQLDERFAEQPKYSKEEEKIARRFVVRESIINAVLIGLWYLFSVAISLYNKWMFKDDLDPDSPNIFPYPLFTTCFHQVVQFSLASTILYLFPSLRPGRESSASHHGGSTPPRQEPNEPRKPLMTTWFYITRIGPCGIGNALDIGLGNMSLKFISLTFFTMCKSSALGFVLIFAFLFRLEKPSWKLVAIIATMTGGVIMMVFGETAFKLLGFILVMTASCASGFRWALTQILLLRNPATSNPFSTSFFLAPVMFVSLLILAIPVEGFAGLQEGFHNLVEARGALLSVGILLFPGCLAFCMTVSEFALLKRTSVVTLSIAGIFKEVVMICSASLAFGDQLTPINIAGLIVTIASIGSYNYIKVKKMREEARRDAHMAGDSYQPVLSSEPPDDGRSGDPPAARQTTRHLIKNSLSIPAGASYVPSREPHMVDNPARNSPVKRPEDLD